jgi:DNA-directed RNA polymerase specialized sigma24 family protein
MAAPTTTTGERQQAIAAFYAAHAEQLRRAVTRRVNAPAATIEDALHNAWAALLERPHVRLDHEGLRWLTTVAIREGWRLASTARELPAGAFQPLAAGERPAAGVLPDPPGDASDPADQAAGRDDHKRRAAALTGLRPRERRELYLQALGYSYDEIAALTDSTYTAVISGG